MKREPTRDRRRIPQGQPGGAALYSYGLDYRISVIDNEIFVRPVVMARFGSLVNVQILNVSALVVTGLISGVMPGVQISLNGDPQEIIGIRTAGAESIAFELGDTIPASEIEIVVEPGAPVLGLSNGMSVGPAWLFWFFDP